MRGDSAAIPQELRDRGFEPDPGFVDDEDRELGSAANNHNGITAAALPSDRKTTAGKGVIDALR